MSLSKLLVCTALTACLLPSPVRAQQSSEMLNSVLWVQSAEEYHAVALTVYRAAERTLDEALRTKTWTAATEQSGRYEELAPAVILDLDETVLDNSAYEARLIRNKQSYSPATWKSWVEEANAGAVPGALSFVRLAASKRIKVFYITGRDASEEEATRRNLKSLGFPLDDRDDTILSQGEHEGWTSDKTSRRQEVVHRYRVLMIIGDDLNDFISAQGLGMQERTQLGEQYRTYWGSRWIMLPNPMYGSWEKAIFGSAGALTPDQRLQMKMNTLDTRESGSAGASPQSLIAPKE
jgi:5'-nucleotidase (lipoprotein e(P4) family)